jgi:hypothetical protein
MFGIDARRRMPCFMFKGNTDAETPVTRLTAGLSLKRQTTPTLEWLGFQNLPTGTTDSDGNRYAIAYRRVYEVLRSVRCVVFSLLARAPEA